MKHFCSPVLSASMAVLALSTAAAGAAVTIDSTSWGVGTGAPTNSAASSTGIVWGNNVEGNANNSAIHATLDGDDALGGIQVITLADNDLLTFTGSINLQTSITDTAGTIQLRAGVYNTNGSANFTGWLGYMAANSTSSGQGALLERTSTGNYWSGTGATTLSSLPSTNGGVTSAARNLTAGTYNFTLSLQRSGANLLVSSNMIRQSDGIDFAPLSNFVDTTPQTFSFNRIGFLSGGGLGADQVTLSNLSLTVVPVPEPSALVLGGLGLLGLLRRRR
jgi:hypothetical protein